jgi:hypothetical protein
VIQRSDKGPLTEFVLELQDTADGKFLVTTDTNGSFAAPSPLKLGPVHVRVLDHPDRKAAVWTQTFETTEWESHEIELVIQPGPTFRLAITPAGIPVRELEARLVQDRDKAEPWKVYFDPIHEGDPPWVRFPSSSSGPHGEHQLEVRSRNGLWFGAANVTRGWGVEPGVVRIDLQPRAAIAGRVIDADGTALEAVSVKLRLSSMTEKSPPREVFTARDGSFQFDVLPVERATLSASQFRYEPVDGQPVELVAGQSTAQVLTMRRLPSGGSIRARVTSETGHYDASSSVTLSSLRNGMKGVVLETADIEWKDEGGRRTGFCEFKDVPDAKYRVTVLTRRELRELTPEVEPARVEAVPPAALDFLVRDSVARADLAFRAHDALTGAEIEGFDSLFALGAKGQFTYDFGAGDEQPLLRGVPLTESFRWRVDKFGYKGISGTDRDFTLEEIHDGRTHRIAEIALQPGWADVVRVTERVTSRKTETPLQGARVLLDGKLAGVTDAEGLLSLDEAAPPRVIRVELEGWRGEDVRAPGTARTRRSLWIGFDMTQQTVRR